jgi:hypothetical protein
MKCCALKSRNPVIQIVCHQYYVGTHAIKHSASSSSLVVVFLYQSLILTFELPTRCVEEPTLSQPLSDLTLFWAQEKECMNREAPCYVALLCS